MVNQQRTDRPESSRPDGFEEGSIRTGIATRRGRGTTSDEHEGARERPPPRTCSGWPTGSDRASQLAALRRDVVRARLTTTSCREFERRLCELAVADGPYRTAMVGEYSDTFETVTPTAARRREGGDAGSVSVDDLSIEFPVARAIQSESVATIDPTWIDADGLGRLFGWDGSTTPDEVVVVVPLTVRGIHDGVLLLHDDERGDVPEPERRLLAGLGEVAAAEFTAVRNRRLVEADTVVDVGFEVTDHDAPLVELAASLSCRIELDGVTHRSDGTVVHYVTFGSVTADALARSLSAASVVESYRRLDDDAGSECRCELTLTPRSVVSVLSEFGANPREMTVEPGKARVSVDVAPSVDVRQLSETLEGAFPETELDHKREVDRPFRPMTEFGEPLADRLTEQQHNVVLAAVEGGFFEYPRESSAKDLADALELSEPTFHEHLRKGLGKITGTYAAEVDGTGRRESLRSTADDRGTDLSV